MASNTEGSSQPSAPSPPPEHPTIRAPSPRRHSSLFGLGVSPPSSDDPTPIPAAPSGAATPTPSSVLSSYPHLGHYIFSLLQNVQFSPPRGAAPTQHPLSVSSSGESDGSGSDEEPGNVSQSESEAASATSGASAVSASSGLSVSSAGTGTSSQESDGKRGASGPSAAVKEELVKKIVALLDNEEEEEVKVTLKPYMGELGKDGILMDQVCLDCMHKRRDDVEGIAYAPLLTPTRARASPALGANPHRPFTPTRVPSFRARTPIGRPHSPAPAQPPTAPVAPSSSGYSSSGSPAASPHMLGGKLSAKASTFAPAPRVVSAPISGAAPAFLPSDPWRDAPSDPPRSASPFGAIGATGMTRTGSNLAIAAPLFNDQSSPFHSPVGTPQRVATPQRTPVKAQDVFSSPASSASRTAAHRGIIPDDDDDDEFSPFGSNLPKINRPLNALSADSKTFTPFVPGAGSHADGAYYAGSTSSGAAHSESSGSSAIDPTEDVESGAGMTPLDVLCSVFTSVPRAELEDALHRSGYDFESAMGMLVAMYTAPRSGQSTPQRVSSPRAMGMRGGRDGYFPQAGRTLRGDRSPMGLGTRSPGGHGGKMCRYFLAGECRRSDCRFSHDLDRAMCRFWLRGHCAKGPNCEFLHNFPANLDVSALSNAMSRVELSSEGYARSSSPSGYQQHEDFPDLASSRTTRGPRFDPSRNRFANAVKRAAPAPPPRDFPRTVSPGPGAFTAEHRPAAVPRASTRLKLRPPTLLPTLSTGASANEQYLSSRATSIRLGHARNACLARAADAFRRGDGAAAKRFSREGKALNQRMLNEAADAAQALVRERQAEAQKAVRERPLTWSDDPGDRGERGKECGGGLGVVMGVASRGRVQGGDRMEQGERTEALLDLHTLHGNEGAEIAGQFLVELERENFRGLAYIVIGEEKHVGTQDPGRGASKVRLGTSVKQALAEWGYAWSEAAGIVCVDPCRI
ncbi:hypothetical protein IAT38_003084 [Cryptococcus sp. DSM 104549]